MHLLTVIHNTAYTCLNHAVYYKDIGDKDILDSYLIPEYEYSIKSFKFRVVESGSHTEYPKHFGMIATLDEKNSIAYLYFYDQDLDFINDSRIGQTMAEFVGQHFQYE